jgi:hypothetical protein
MAAIGKNGTDHDFLVRDIATGQVLFWPSRSVAFLLLRLASRLLLKPAACMLSIKPSLPRNIQWMCVNF